MDYGHSLDTARSGYVTISVPLPTGHSETITLKVGIEDVKCEGCKNHACVRLDDMRIVQVGECPDCALDNEFRYSYGIFIANDSPGVITTSIDSFVSNCDKFVLSPHLWLDMFVRDELGKLLRREHEQTNMNGSIETLFEEICSSEESVRSPKLASLVRRRIDVVEGISALRLDEDDSDYEGDQRQIKRAKRCR